MGQLVLQYQDHQRATKMLAGTPEVLNKTPGSDPLCKRCASSWLVPTPIQDMPERCGPCVEMGQGGGLRWILISWAWST